MIDEFTNNCWRILCLNSDELFPLIYLLKHAFDGKIAYKYSGLFCCYMYACVKVQTI